MQTISSQLESVFRAAIREALRIDADPLIAQSQNEAFGDYQSNAAMGLAKQVSESDGKKTNPRAIAEQVNAKLSLGDMAAEVSIAGPGFINVKLSPAWVTNLLRQAAGDDRLGIERAANPQVVVVDYSAPNVAKQMHVGNMRSTIIGDAICRVLAFGGESVIRQNHIGDWGTQFGMLIAYLKETHQSAHADIADLDAFYKAARKRFDADAVFANESRATVVRLQAGGAEELARWKEMLSASRRYFDAIYLQLGVLLSPADERGESFYNSLLPGVVTDLKSAGIAAVSEGAVVAFTDGSEAPLIIEKTGGGYGYATTDLAAVRYRVATLHADRVIYVVGAPQSQHFKQVFAIAKTAGWVGNATLEHAPFGSILGEDGKMFKSRSGEAVKLADLLAEAQERALSLVTKKNPDLPIQLRQSIAHAVGIGAVKYADLSKDRTSDYVFSFDKMLALDGNTAPYLQYAHARVRSIFRRAKEQGAQAGELRLESPYELSLAKHLLRMADVIALVGRELKPHHLCTYLYELSTKFSGFYENCPVLKNEDALRASRLTLCDVTGRTLALGLELLGIEHPEEM